MKRATIAALAAMALMVLMVPGRAMAVSPPPTTPIDARWDAGPDTNYGLWGMKTGVFSVYLPEADASLVTQMTFRDTPDAIAYDQVEPASFWSMGAVIPEEQDRPGYVRLAASLTRVWSMPQYVSVWTTSPDGTHSAPLRWTLGTVTESATNPGPRADLVPLWDTTYKGVGVSFPSYEITMLGMAVSLGHDNPTPLWSIDDSLALGEVTNPWSMGISLTNLDTTIYPVGTPVTITLWQGAADGMHYSSTVFNSSLLLPDSTTLALTGPSAPKAGTAPTFTVSTRFSTADGIVAVPGVSVGLQTRTTTGAWVTRAKALTSATGTATLKIPALREGVYARAVILLGSTKTSSSLTMTHRRVVTAVLAKKTITHGRTVTLAGATTGAAPGTVVVIERCATATSACTAYKSVKTTSTGKWSAAVPAPATAGKSSWYRARLTKLSPLTPTVYSARSRLLAS